MKADRRYYIGLKKAAREEKDKTYDERREKALREGKKYLYITCPLCGLSRPLRSYKGSVRFTVKPDFAIIQARYGTGGRGQGFFLKEDESLSLSDVKKKYPDVYENLRLEVKRLATMFKRED